MKFAFAPRSLKHYLDSFEFCKLVLLRNVWILSVVFVNYFMNLWKINGEYFQPWFIDCSLQSMVNVAEILATFMGQNSSGQDLGDELYV